MSWRFTPWAVPLLLAAVAAAAAAVHTARHPSRPARPLAVFMSAVAAWCLIFTLRLLAADLTAKLFWAQAQYVPVAVLPVAWAAFASSYGGGGPGLGRRPLALLSVLPALTLLLVFTNGRHGLVWSRLPVQADEPAFTQGFAYGPAVWAFLLYAYSVFLLATAPFVSLLDRSTPLRGWKTGVLVLGLAAPWVAAGVFFGGVRTSFNPIPFTLLVTALAFAWALFRARLLDLAPVGRDAVIETLPDAVVVADAEGRVVHCNPAASRLPGLAGCLAPGRSLGESLAPWPELRRRASEAGESRTAIEMAAGEERRRYDVRVTPVTDESGAVHGRVLAWRDVTEDHARTERVAALAARQRILYELLETVAGKLDLEATLRAAVSVILTRTDFRNVVVGLPDETDGSLVLRGRQGASLPARLGPGEGVMGRAFLLGETQVVPDVTTDPDYVAVGPTARCELVVPLRRGVKVLGVLNLESDRPETFGPDDVALAESLADAVALAVENAGLYRDLNQGRERLEALIRASRDGIVLLGRWRVIQVINPKALRLLGLPGDAASWLGRPAEELIEALRARAPEAAGAADAELQRVAAGDTTPGEGDLVVGARALHWLSLPVQSGEGTPGRLIALRDVTEEKRAAELRDDLTRAMVHDLKNPLVSIDGAIGLLAEQSAGLPEDRRQLVEMARRNSERMRNLVDGILDVSRLESGRLPLRRASIALEPLVRDAVERQRVVALARRLRIEIEVPKDMPPAFVDPELMGRVLQNLIGNAIKFVPEGGRVRVHARVADGAIELAVADDGPGLPPELQGRLFRKFAVGPQRERGSGLGLAFCRLAVEAHGGRIRAENTPGAGASFVLTLPAAEANPSSTC